MSDPIGTATVAKLLGMSHRAVKRRAALGQLPTIARLDGGAYVFDRAAIMRVQAEQIAAERARLDALENAATS